MRCPVDETTLAMAERYGVEIDYCPQCRGVWLDRGELDRIIQRAGVAGARSEDGGHGRGDDHDRRHRDDDDEHEHGEGWRRRSGRKRGGALAALGDLLGGGED